MFTYQTFYKTSKITIDFKMPIHDLVEVRILQNRQSLQEYSVPPGETAPSHETVRYIEAIAGERFEVNVRFLVGYRIENAANLVWTLSLDGMELEPTPIDRRELTVQNGKLLTPAKRVLSKLSINVSTTSAKVYHYTFGVVELSMSLPFNVPAGKID